MSTTTTTTQARVPVKERDFLDQDPSIRGQRYACMSFVDPEGVISNKEAFVMGRFMRALAKDVSAMLDNLDAKYGAQSPDDRQTIEMVRRRHAYLWSDGEMQAELTTFRSLHSLDLDDEFHRNNGFVTSMRGFKIRGVYDSVEEATERAKAIKRFDDKFNVFISEVGCWCPFNPAPESIKDAEYAETELNTLMKSYQESQEQRDKMYESRKQSLLDDLASERDEWLRNKQDALANPAGQAADASLLAGEAGEAGEAVEAVEGEEAA